jgi:carboxymethylenebutenolidase
MRNLIVAALLFTACATQSAQTPSQRLSSTPRHNEWVEVKYGDRVVRAWVAYPEVGTKAAAVLVIHENRGLTDFERAVADKLAENGYLAIAPDLLSGGTYPNADAAREGISKLPPAQVIADLDAVADMITRDPAASGKLYVAGFCWGGGKTWAFANHRKGLSAAFPFYGTGPQDEAGVANIDAPVYGFYGGADARVNATVPKTEELMKAAGKRFEPVYYEGAGHAFMRAGSLPDASEPNKRAHDEGWKRWLALLAK